MNMRFWHIWLAFFDNECGEGQEHWFVFEGRSVGVRRSIAAAEFSHWGTSPGWVYAVRFRRWQLPAMITLTQDGYLRGVDENIDAVAMAGL